MERYRATSIRRTEDGKDFYSSQILPDIPRRPEDTIITTESGQRLDRIAFRYYDDAKLWWVIAAANNLGRGDWSVPEGIQLRIPQNLSAVSREIESINNER